MSRAISHTDHTIQSSNRPGPTMDRRWQDMIPEIDNEERARASRERQANARPDARLRGCRQEWE